MAKRRDLYEVLGVGRDADAGTIRKRYRQLARELHPDVKPDDPAAEERFKEVSHAFSVLSDPERRQAYDEFGEASLESGFDADEARAAKARFRRRRPQYSQKHFGEDLFGGSEGFFGEGGVEDLFGGLFGRARSRGPTRGADLETVVELDFMDAVRGGERALELRRDGGASRTVTVRFPPGVADGDRLRVQGHGEAGTDRGHSGDLWVRVRVRPHPVFERVGHDLVFELPISVREAVLGAEVEVPTPEGRATLRVPPGTHSGTRLRLRGKGVPRRKGPRGDLLARVQIRVPEKLDPETREAVEKLERFEDPSLRERLFRRTP